ncbi:UNVERIFIED_ORG: hypothetical protein GGE63_006537 [Rhizobium esperanzae]|jgi:hypothetical protein
MPTPYPATNACGRVPRWTDLFITQRSFEMNVESYRRRSTHGGQTPARQASLIRDNQRHRQFVARIASPELLPENGLLPHLNCSRRINLGSCDEEGQHGDTCGIGGSDQLSLCVRRAGREGEDVRRVRGAHGLSSQACDATAARRTQTGEGWSSARAPGLRRRRAGSARRCLGGVGSNLRQATTPPVANTNRSDGTSWTRRYE